MSDALDKPKCRHGVTLCYRCGLGGTISEPKWQSKLAEAKAEKVKRRADEKTKQRPPRPACINRINADLSLDCRCGGVLQLYRCGVNDNDFCLVHPMRKDAGRVVETQEVVLKDDMLFCANCQQYQPTEVTENG